MDKYSRDCSYEEMSKGVGGQSIPSECWEEPLHNKYEDERKGWNADGYDQSAMQGEK